MAFTGYLCNAKPKLNNHQFVGQDSQGIKDKQQKQKNLRRVKNTRLSCTYVLNPKVYV